VELLLQREDIDPNTTDTKYGQTPVERAAQQGREGVLKLLLEREDIDLNTPGAKTHLTPLGWAAWAGNARVVELLLQREDINPETADTKHGPKPHSSARRSKGTRE